MNILIAGAGEIGAELCRVLSQENHNVTVIDENESCLHRLSEHVDVLTRLGSATSPHVLLASGIESTELLVAVTSSDEVNMICSTMAKRLGVPRVIARVRSSELSEKDTPIQPSELGIDVLIHPEESAANQIMELLQNRSATDVVSLADGKIQLIGIRIEKDSPVIGFSLSKLARLYPEYPFRIVAISRNQRTLIPRGHNHLHPGDQLYLLADTDNLQKLLEILGHKEQVIRRVMIAGGTALGQLLVKKLSQSDGNWKIKVIEPDPDVARRMAESDPDVLVLQGNPTDPDLLAIEGIQEMDAFISVTHEEESNIISSLLAKHLEVDKTISLVSNPQYIPLGQTIGLDAMINIKASATDDIHREIRKGVYKTVKALQGVRAEIVELVISNGSPLTRGSISQLDLPDGLIIGGIVHNGTATIATGTSAMQEGDRAILFGTPESLKRLEKLC
ncbi:MAG: Trk system potassium transporter TrkA [Balneolaceae bacterium]